MLMKSHLHLKFLCLCVTVFCIACSIPKEKTSEVEGCTDVDLVPSDFPVNFALFTKGEQQFVAYYDTAHVMTLASRKLGEQKWEYVKLDTKVPWDSHNYISMYIDDSGFIHIVGNMHSDSLKYFKSSKPLDIHSMQSVHRMTGREEDITTYPEFMRGPGNELIFHYRYGRSGNGYEIYNILNTETQTWTRLLDRPLIDGEGKMNAYMQGPVLGPDNYYHLIWVWRDTPDCSTNHTLSYAKSKDLLRWESIRGEAIFSPLTIRDTTVVVDNTPIKGGLINIGIKLGFDIDKRPVIGYHKYDSVGNTQLFLTRYENNNWKKVQQTSWNYRWDFSGWGTIVNELLIDSPISEENGSLRFGYHRMDIGSGQVITEESTLKPLKEGPYQKEYPDEIEDVRSSYDGMLVYKIKDAGMAYATFHKYILRWEALSPNRDQKREGVLPPPSMLQVYELYE